MTKSVYLISISTGNSKVQITEYKPYELDDSELLHIFAFSKLISDRWLPKCSVWAPSMFCRTKRLERRDDRVSLTGHFQFSTRCSLLSKRKVHKLLCLRNVRAFRSRQPSLFVVVCRIWIMGGTKLARIFCVFFGYSLMLGNHEF